VLRVNNQPKFTKHFSRKTCRWVRLTLAKNQVFGYNIKSTNALFKNGGVML
jgi:hypothetical protein